MKILRKIIITLLIITGLVVGSALLISHYYGEEVKNAVIGRLDQKLRMEVDVEEVSFSVLRRFPHASVGLGKATLQQEADTLFRFERIDLQFDLIDLIKGQQKVERISFSNGSMKLPIDRNGDHPYQDIWKKDIEEAEKEKRSSFELKRLEWENVAFHYRDRRNRTEFRTDVDYGFLQGRFGEKESELRARIDGRWNALKLGKESWEEVDRPYSIETEGRIDQEQEKIHIERTSLAWNGIDGELNGHISYGKNSRLDLKYNFPYHGIQDYLKAWPDLLKLPENHDIQARMRIEGRWEGVTGRTPGPSFNGKFEFNDGTVTHEASGIRIEGLRGKGHFDSRDEKGRPKLELETFRGELGGGVWEGKGHLAGGRTERLEVHLKGESPVEESVRFLGIDTLEEAGGDWKASVRIKGRLSDLFNPRTGNFDRSSISGRAELEDAFFKVKGSPNSFGKVNGTFLLHDMNAAVKELSGEIAGSELKLEGRFYDLLPYLLFPDRTLRVEAELRSEELTLDPLLSTEGKSSSEDYELDFPEDLRFELSTQLGALAFRAFRAEDLSGRFKLGPGGLEGEGISMELAEGKLHGHMALNAGSSPYGIRAGAELKGIRIAPLFEAFENFGQDLVRPEHLKGILDAGIQYRSSLRGDLGVPPASVSSSADIQLRKGELIGFRPLIALGEKLSDKKVLNSFLDLEGLEQELHHIRFQTLKNRISIENEKLIIPRFDVGTNALDIKASGEHGFDGRIDHRFEIHLDELLSKPKESEFGYLRDDGKKKKLFVKMTGSTEDPELGFDREAARRSRKERRKEEKEEVKDALRKEFGLFGGADSLSTKEDEEKEESEEKDEPVFDVEWGEEKEDKKEDKGEKEEQEEQGKSLWDRLGIGGDDEEEDKEEQEGED